MYTMDDKICKQLTRLTDYIGTLLAEDMIKKRVLLYKEITPRYNMIKMVFERMDILPHQIVKIRLCHNLKNNRIGYNIFMYFYEPILSYTGEIERGDELKCINITIECDIYNRINKIEDV